ncbi:MAG: DUF2007 domain-containing protein [Vicingaceae bacterium]
MSWTLIYSSNQAHLVEIVKNILEENSIEYSILDKRDSVYGSVVSAGIEIHIQSEDFVRTKKLISDFESN